MAISMENLDDDEKKRLEDSISLILKLFSQGIREEIIDIFLEDKVTEIRLKDDDNSREAGYIEQTKEDENKYIVAYDKYDRMNRTKSLHQSIHELIHILGVPNDKPDLKESQGKDCFGGLEIIQYTDGIGYEYYGNAMKEACDEILTKIALSSATEGSEKYTADDVIMSNDVEFDSGYKPIIPIARLLAFAMNNEFYKEYEELIEDGRGVVDCKTNIVDQDGNNMPVNDLFYGMCVDPLRTEQVYDRYSKSGEYKRFNTKFDEVFRGNEISCDTLKDAMISITDMFHNKMYNYLMKGFISEEIYDQADKQYNGLFSQVCEWYRDNYGVEITFDPEENMRMYESRSRTKEEIYQTNQREFLGSRHINTALNIEAQARVYEDMRSRNLNQQNYRN